MLFRSHSLGFVESGVLSSMANGVLPSSSPLRSVASAYGRGVKDANKELFAKYPRWRRDADGKSLVTFFNKCLGIFLLRVSLLLLAGCGGEREKKGGVRTKMLCSYPGGDATCERAVRVEEPADVWSSMVEFLRFKS